MVYLYQRKGLEGKSPKGRRGTSQDPVKTRKIERQPKRSKMEIAIAELAEKDPLAFVEAMPGTAQTSYVNNYQDYRALMRSRTEVALRAIERVIEISNSSQDAAILGLGLKASLAILEHGWGRPVQAVAVAEVKEQNSEIVALSREKLEAIARAVLPGETESETGNGSDESSGDSESGVVESY